MNRRYNAGSRSSLGLNSDRGSPLFKKNRSSLATEKTTTLTASFPKKASLQPSGHRIDDIRRSFTRYKNHFSTMRKSTLNDVTENT